MIAILEREITLVISMISLSKLREGGAAMFAIQRKKARSEKVGA